jgi:outer membrane lipoprotein SlyB
MTRSFIRFAVLASGLALPGLAAGAPALPTNQAVTLLNHPASTSGDGTVLSMRAVPTPNQPATGIGGGASVMTGGPNAGMGTGASGSPGGSGLSSMLTGGLGGSAIASMSSLIGTASAPKPATAAPQAQEVEFVLRMDDGSTQTVVQGEAKGLHKGDRVRVVHGERTHLIRAG